MGWLRTYSALGHWNIRRSFSLCLLEKQFFQTSQPHTWEDSTITNRTFLAEFESESEWLVKVDTGAPGQAQDWLEHPPR